MPVPTTLPRSTFIKSFQWTGERVSYPEKDVKGDSFPFTWADDDHLYTSAGDPNWGETPSGLDVEKFTGNPPDYKITKQCHMNDYLGWGGDGPKPTGMIFIDGVLYLAVQNVRRSKRAPFSLRSQHGSDAHIISSSSSGFPSYFGSLWSPAFQNIKEPMFPGHRFGGPVFINFGKANANARDNYVYAVSPDQWDNGSNLRIGRVPADSIVRKEAWEFLCAWKTDGQPAWHHDLDEAIPILSLHRQLSQPEMVYVAGINRYLLLTWTLHKDFSGDDGTDLLILESPEPWGPFSIVYHEELWESKEFTPYCPKLPLKWMAEDGLSGWMQFSGSWTERGQQANYYRSHVRQFGLTLA